MESTPAARREESAPLTQRELVRAWFPLWISWFAMALEVPVITSCIARLADPHISLAALGGILIPVSFIIEAPILMLLSASTALTRDEASFLFLRRVMMTLGAILTAVHFVIAATPLYDVVTVDILGCPPEVCEAARFGLLVMTPWTWSIAYRRFYQGVAISFGRSRLVGFGTLVRLSANIIVSVWCFHSGNVSGALTAAAALTAGVFLEAVFIGLTTRQIVRDQVRRASSDRPPLTVPFFTRFYVPLALTALLDFLVQPLASAALSRMPQPIEGLALLPVIGGLLFLLRGPGFALNEVVISSLGRAGGADELRRFAHRLTLVCGAVGLAFLLTPLGDLWFGIVVKLPAVLAATALGALWCGFPNLLLAPAKSLYGGTLVHRHRTRAISEGTLLSLAAFGGLISFGALYGAVPGIYIVIGAMSIAAVAQVGWLKFRSRGL